MNEKEFKEKENVDDRRLGDEWLDWDGDLSAHTTEIVGRKSLFLVFSGLSAILVTGVLAGAFYLIYPRLAEAVWLPYAAGMAFAAVGVLFVLQFIVLLAAGAGLGFVSPVARTGAAMLRPFAFRLSKLSGVSTDRMRASYIELQNMLVSNSCRRHRPDDVLVLLPRCLTREALKTARDIAGEYNCRAAVAGGGSVARKLIAKHRPRAIVAVACERDLVSGLVDTGLRFEVMALSNIRPNGPCKDTTCDMEKYRRSLEMFVGKEISDSKLDNNTDVEEEKEEKTKAEAGS